MLEAEIGLQGFSLAADETPPTPKDTGATLLAFPPPDDEKAAKLQWEAVPDRPLDIGGPVDRPFERMGADFANVPVHAHFAAVAARFGSRIAVSDGARRLTYAEFAAAVFNLAQLIAAAVPEGRAVGLLLRSSVWYPLAMFAAMAAGRPCVPLNPRDPAERIASLAADARLPAIVAHSCDGLGDWAEGRDVRCINIADALNGDLRPAAALPQVSVDAPALVLYTSGSTGRPKGVVNSQRSLLQRVQQYVDAAHINENDAFLPLSGPTTIAGTREIMSALLTGAALHLVEPEAAGLRAIRRQIRTEGISIIYVVPTLLRAIIATAEGSDFGSLRMLRVGGEKALWSDVALIRRVMPRSCLIQISYASTETTGSQWFLPHGWTERGASPPVGHLLPGLSYAVVGDDGAPVRRGETGELLIKSPHVFLGYWEDGRIVPTPADPDDARLRVFATGDLAEIDERGLLRIVGRKDRQIKINGRRVEPAELELAARRAPRVRDAVVVVTHSNELVLFAVPADGAGTEARFDSDLREHLRQKLPNVLHPARLHTLEGIPRLSGGKADIAALRTLDRAKHAAAAPPEARAGRDLPEAKRAVEQTWRRILNTRTAEGAWDEAGGDSLKLMRCVLELEEMLGRELNMEDFTIDMTAAEMVAAVSRTCTAAPAEAAQPEMPPRLILFPGSVGYGPSLAAFGAEMAEVAHVSSIRYPDLNAVLAGHGTVEDMAQYAVDQIRLIQPHGDLRLLGYSLGGGVAFEAAVRLIAAGRTVKFFGVLDTNIAGDINGHTETALRILQRIRSHRITVRRVVCRVVAKSAAWLGSEERFARFLQRSLWQLFPDTRFMLRLELDEVLRMRAFVRWVAQPKPHLPITGTLFACRRKGAPASLGWDRVFARLDIVPIVGGHLDLVVEPHIAINRPLVERAVASTYI